ncbi:hypothetical protein [Heyndrickxia oleronia]|uniref:Uncharacterized protein n=1 Tax=Heyndrickxia oleronia TaxID=38875 RepID=A0AAW6SYK1_9BACI|nr:hypothetical protein [Heyndrickxia oleronia]MDH5161806.1 hypothetical protein [Heyndrickxia oleronia]
MSKFFSKLMGTSAYPICSSTIKRTFCYLNTYQCAEAPATGYKYVDSRTGEDCSPTYFANCQCRP